MRAVITGAAAVLLAACGGSGDDAGSGGAPATATATLAAPASGKAFFKRATPLAVTLKDAAGNTVTGPLTCTSSAVTVAADCSSVTATSIGTRSITVSSGDVSASLSLRVIPQAHPFGSHGPVSQHGAGQINSVVTTGGLLYMWGANPYGALGQNRDSDTFTTNFLTASGLPVAVRSPDASTSLSGVVASSGATTGGGALVESGEILTWGDDTGNALGRNTVNTGRMLLAGKVVDPTGASTLKGIVSFARGASNNVALSDGGRVYSWGQYTGVASGTGKLPVEVPGPGGDPIADAAAVAAGWNWSMALRADGRVLTWGFGTASWLGWAQTQAGQLANYVVDAGTGQPITDVVAISAGYQHGLALTSAGEVWAWGLNNNGKLGQGDSVGFFGARKVRATGGGNLSGVAMVAAGGHHSMALANDGTVLAWGLNTNAQLGDGATNPRGQESALPAKVVGTAGTGTLAGVVAVAAGYAQSLALLDDGRVLIWGDGFNGGLGQGQIDVPADSFVPVPVRAPIGSGTLNLGETAYWPNLFNRAR